jgi:pilus assembly protein CpaF
MEDTDLDTSKFSATNEYNELKTRIHDELIYLLDLSLIDTLDKPTLAKQIRKHVEQILQDKSYSTPLNYAEREKLFIEIQDEVRGLGPIEPFMNDSSISDVLVNTYKHVYVERAGKLFFTDARFKDEAHLRKIIDKIVSAVGRRIDESSPMVDARLPDGSRVNAIIPPLAIDGSTLSIRRFSVEPLELEDLVTLRTLTPTIGDFLKATVKCKLNILISGGTGTGKTTLLNVLSRFIPPDERVITIEDSAELQLKQQHVIRLETRPPNVEGKGEVTQRDLVRNSLRMRPDRIIIGEVRAGEALDMLQAMNTGHEGSLTTVHANSARDALMRLETIVAMGGLQLPTEAVRRYISSALNVVIHVSRLMDGSRKVVSIQEITGMEGPVITMQELFAFEQTHVGPKGVVRGRFRAKGILPRFMDKFKVHGMQIPLEIFDENSSVEV